MHGAIVAATNFFRATIAAVVAVTVAATVAATIAPCIQVRATGNSRSIAANPPAHTLKTFLIIPVVTKSLFSH